MNIFYLDHDPIQCAEWMVDKHVVKMIVESAQLLSTAVRVLDGQKIEVITDKGKKKIDYYVDTDLLKVTHINHPSAIWVRQSIENYEWLLYHLHALCREYTYRYGKHHSYEQLARRLEFGPANIPKIAKTPIICAMPDEYKISDDGVTNYRNYYKFGKAHIHSWKNRQPPPWI